MKDLTEKQEIVLKALKDFINENGYPPSVREMCKVLGKKSPGTVQVMFRILKDKGYIDYEYNRCRTIRILEKED